MEDKNSTQSRAEEMMSDYRRSLDEAIAPVMPSHADVHTRLEENDY